MTVTIYYWVMVGNATTGGVSRVGIAHKANLVNNSDLVGNAHPTGNNFGNFTD
ncbi:hypothetical protein [Planktothricoides raciborskii]|uniref:Uncharacterized protein n=2 Tax=Planktothricoides raciborskii TaxID=132608 RepID=A0AAU8JDB6_9CYAN|nr:hypothetical protein [Planktothricoides raciborskii]MBD2544320.1 hypothetical protein [Planktothricoides raciborskii FACHB-1370]MBD2582167.1 hypothetical protein [Planktothricoides raciborskii FACHB-1261]